MKTSEPQYPLTCAVRSPNPYRLDSVPTIATLYRAGFHRFRRRWTKRLFKRPGRWLYDFGYGVLKLGGEGVIAYAAAGGEKRLRFAARHRHFAYLYMLPPGTIFEPQVMGLLEILMRDDEVFFDGGANWGMLSLHAATLPGWTGPIYAFEPMAETFADLSGLVAQAGLEQRITCLNLALSDSDDEAEMMLGDGANSGTATLELGALDGLRFPVRRARLDDLDLPAPSFIKLDVEGHEGAALTGAARTLQTAKPMVIFETWYHPGGGDAWRAPFRVLEAAGYEFFRPVWLRNAEPDAEVWPDAQPVSNDLRILRLLPMSEGHRPLMAEHINVFACHRDRLGELESRFADSAARAGA